MAGHPFENLHADARISAAVTDRADVEGGEHPVGIASRFVLHANRMSLRVHPEGFFARNGALDRAIEEPGSQCGLRLIAHVLLAPECSSIGDEFDRDLVVVDAEHASDVVAIVPDALAA